ncbi:hypothetical protein EB796_014474 [Bugula neritina]|uniref:Uncharacterized protein n=1 Tax=Bugula neritina TaxID=10212 RepID=A0A7J7JNM6_BUGNE|nr:hypothetical protein EB796_014474 [Bugula neritina]
MIGGDLVIEPITDITLPSEDDVVEEKRQLKLEKHVRHMIYKVKQPSEETTVNDYEELPEDSVAGKEEEKRATVNQIYVPVHAVVDYSLYKKLGSSQSKVIRYIKIFYNAVNELYSTISYPSVSVSIQGITICTYKYCRATPISCDGSVVNTPKPTPPGNRFTVASKTTEKPYVPPTSANCGKPCSDTPNMRINGQSCSNLLSSSSNKRNFCDNPTIIQHCCSTRARMCKGYHWITESCDSTCQDNPSMKINGKRCVSFLATQTDRENYCDQSITKTHCCATRRKVCTSSIFG